jgi:hypothetical protein
MGQKRLRNNPCWCSSGKKLKKCHGAPSSGKSAPLQVRPATTAKPITTHTVFDGKRRIERPGLLTMTVVVERLDSVDTEIVDMRRAWTDTTQSVGAVGLTGVFNDLEHKLRAVRYHRDNLLKIEAEAIRRFTESHHPTTGASVEERTPDMLFEVEGFLYQVKSTLDMFARLFSAVGLGSVGHSFGDHGDRLLKQLQSVPSKCFAEAAELCSLIETAQSEWLDQAVSFRDQIAHQGMLNEFRCFVQEPYVGAPETAIHYPSIPGGERATKYVNRIESALRNFIDALVRIGIRMAAILRKSEPSSEYPDRQSYFP